jgi:hypothetical protein
VQWEFAGRIGPPPGRYVVRRYAGDDVQRVVVIAELDGTPARRRPLRGRRARRVPASPPPAVVPVTRVTVIDALPLTDARAWLARAAHADSAGLAVAAAATLAQLVSGHRVAAADPTVADLDPARALASRIGYGRGEQVADGAWEAARDLRVPDPPRRRRAEGHHQERLTALLAARDAALACEELALRARADLDRGRDREAALQLEAALTAALAELEGWREHGDLAARLGELAGYRAAAAAAAAAAREGRLDPADIESVTTTLARLEAALRARTVYAAL